MSNIERQSDGRLKQKRAFYLQAWACIQTSVGKKHVTSNNLIQFPWIHFWCFMVYILGKYCHLLVRKMAPSNVWLKISSHFLIDINRLWCVCKLWHTSCSVCWVCTHVIRPHPDPHATFPPIHSFLCWLGPDPSTVTHTHMALLRWRGLIVWVIAEIFPKVPILSLSLTCFALSRFKGISTETLKLPWG